VGRHLAKCCFFVRLRAFFVRPGLSIACKKDLSAALGQALSPVANRRAPRASRSALTSDGAAARGGPFAHRGKAGVALSRGFLNSLRPTGSWFFPRSARYERAATWRRGGRHRYVPCAINAVRRVATKNAGLPGLVPAGRGTA